MYNDLGFLAGDRLLVLVEAQSTWSENILIRFLMYLGETYHRYIEKNGLNIYNSRRIELPRPELYIVYTGDRVEIPDEISLKRIFWEDHNCSIEVTAKVIRDSKAGDIIEQFISFSKVFDEQRKLYPGNKQMAIQETIRICKQKDVLARYLEQEEVALIMIEIFDHDKALEFALKEEREAGLAEGHAEGLAEGHAEGLAEGHAEGLAEGDKLRLEKTAKSMYEAGLSLDMITKILELSKDQVLEILGLQAE